jgi:hypothetical protein
MAQRLRWRYEERDVAPGRQMVECFKPFLRGNLDDAALLA